METQETVVCDICDKEVSAQSIQVHKIHCERNTIKCQSCGKKLNRYDLEKHNNEFHIQKKCETCQQSIEIQYFSDHDCPKRPIICEYCEASFPADQFKFHNIECGNRTDQCLRCREYIKKNVYKQHCLKNTCKPYTEPKAKLYEEIQAERIKVNKPQVEKPEIIDARHSKAEEVKRYVPLARAINRDFQSGNKEVKIENSKSNQKLAIDKNKQGNFNISMKKKQTENAGQKSAPSIQEYPEISRTKAQRVVKEIQPAKQKSSLAPQKKQISPAIHSKVPYKNEYQDYPDYQNYNENYEQEIPYEFLDNRFPQESKNIEYQRIPNEYAQPIPNNLSSSLSEFDNEILQQVIAESTKDNFDYSEEERLIKEVLLKSLNDR
ncbi:hypothetical protein SteCoe_10482 [Stentor coeruleus]|uniref:TRAF-type domain-containing protein n=1 Tax=Stentor coeruleus TaxID=5963 RepID=A0A1R2CFE5_9CILI|nr:hypothetical protein SteCoe_10482 [Stentor coeruleus]